MKTQDEQTKKAIEHLENALADLKKTVLPVNPKRYRVMSEPALDLCRKLGKILAKEEALK